MAEGIWFSDWWDDESNYEAVVTVHQIEEYTWQVGIGDLLPDVDLFLTEGGCVRVPLEATFMAAFKDFAAPYKEFLEGQR